MAVQNALAGLEGSRLEALHISSIVSRSPCLFPGCLSKPKAGSDSSPPHLSSAAAHLPAPEHPLARPPQSLCRKRPGCLWPCMHTSFTNVLGGSRVICNEAIALIADQAGDIEPCMAILVGSEAGVTVQASTDLWFSCALKVTGPDQDAELVEAWQYTSMAQGLESQTQHMLVPATDARPQILFIASGSSGCQQEIQAVLSDDDSTSLSVYLCSCALHHTAPGTATS